MRTAKLSLQCRRILGGRNLVRVRNIVVAAIFDFMTVEDLGRVEIVSLTVGARAKEGKGGGEGEKKKNPFPLPSTRSISSSLREVSTWRFCEQIARSKKTPALQATLNLALISGYPVDSATKRFNNRDQMFSE